MLGEGPSMGRYQEHLISKATSMKTFPEVHMFQSVIKWILGVCIQEVDGVTSYFHTLHFLHNCLTSYYLSRPTVYFLAQFLCVGVCTVNGVNTILQAMMWWLSTIAWQSSLCVFDGGRWIVSGAFRWWNNCFQRSPWSNCSSTTQNLYLLRICCPLPLYRDSWSRATGQIIFSQKEREREVEEPQQRLGWRGWLHAHTSEWVWFSPLCTVWLCGFVSVHLQSEGVRILTVRIN